MKQKGFWIFLFSLLAACSHADEEETPEEERDIVSSVTVTPISQGPMTEYLELNATSSYLLKNVVKASVNGYIKEEFVTVGKLVNPGELLFTLKTKESESIGNAVNALDSSFKFSGTIKIKSPLTGYVSEVDHQVGDYVQDGDQLALISDYRSFVFVMNLPYELRPYAIAGKNVLVLLPDGKILHGSIKSITPIVDSTSQTQNVFISVAERNLPTNLVAKVRLEKATRANSISLPKEAILSDEMQKNFWVMKLIDSSTATKVPIIKGIETSGRIEILSPKFSTEDRFILNGNFGLPDTARIKIIQQ